MSASELTDVGSAAQCPEGVVILGMHRSGTSLITRLVSMLGLAVCRHDDVLVGRARNPRGHWESISLLRFNDRLLEELGGSWFCPPLLGPRELSRMLRKHGAEALATLHDAHPERPWVWKDPRTCVLLPFWSAVLERRAAYVLVVRHPLEVSDSLARRSGCTQLLSLALWERYTRQAMLGAAGRPVMVCTYDRVLADPAAWCERLVEFLGELGLRSLAVDRAAIDAFVMDELRHSHRAWTDLRAGAGISPEQVALAHAASAFTVQRSYVPPALPAETPETAAIFREIAARRPRARSLEVLPARLVAAVDADADTDADEGPAPPVSVVLARCDAAVVRASLLALGDTLPSGSEMLVCGGSHVDDGGFTGEVSLRQIDCDRPPSEAEALALGAQAAGGRIVLLSAGALSRCGRWYASAKEALAVAKVGGVEPVVRVSSSPQARHFGRVFSDEGLTTRLLAGRAAKKLVPVALLSGSLCAYDRALLAAAGGVDGSFVSAGAAVAELSLRLWRMGFRCCVLSGVEVWTAAGDDGAGEDRDGAEKNAAGDDAAGLYDRLRIASLHFSPVRLQAFTDRASRLPAYEQAAERLASSDVQRRRAAIDALCALPADRYFERFPPQPASAGGRPAAVGPPRGSPLARLRKRSGL